MDKIVMKEFLSLGGGIGAQDVSLWLIIGGVIALVVIAGYIRGKVNG